MTKYKYTYQIISDSDARVICNLLGGADAAKMFSYKIDEILSKSIRELQSRKVYADLSYAECKITLEKIEKHSKELAKNLERISYPEFVIDNEKMFQIAQLITNGMCNAHLDTIYLYPEFWKIKEKLELLNIGAQQALTDIQSSWDKSYPIDHPRDYFLKQSISAYMTFFKKKPGVYRGSKFVQVIEKLLDIGGLGKEGVSTFRLLDRACKQKKLK